jgi:hypothetical protein
MAGNVATHMAAARIIVSCFEIMFVSCVEWLCSYRFSNPIEKPFPRDPA